MRKPPPPPPPRRRKSRGVLTNDRTWEIKQGDCIDVMRRMPPRCVHTIVTSPPYWSLRDYAAPGQLGWEETPERYVAALVRATRAARRVLRDDGTFWLNLGDTRVDRSLMGMPWRVALALVADGWVLRSEVIWHKTSLMPEPWTDRPTTDHEQLFLFAKRPQYYFDAYALRGPSKTHPGLRGRNKRTVWRMSSSKYQGAHFATFPVKLPDLCIRAGTSAHGACVRCGKPWERQVERLGSPKHIPQVNDVGCSGRNDLGFLRDERGRVVWGDLGPTANPDRWSPTWRSLGWAAACSCSGVEVVPCVVMDFFAGSGSTLVAAQRLLRRGVGIELNPETVELATRRIRGDFPLGSLPRRAATGALIGPPTG